MARLVTKFKYIKPNSKKKIGGYAKYIATREGVEKIDESKKYAPSTKNQQKLIEKILKDFPDSKDSFEYQDYKLNTTIENAREFITRAIEDNSCFLKDTTYADYIATRPRVEKIGIHGLFTNDGVEINLSKVSTELNEYKGNVWTAIISLRREDSQKLGFDTGTRWRDMIRSNVQELSKNFKIPMTNLKWYGAFHNESHHPHIHLIIYSSVENEGYLSKQGVNNLRSALARDTFAQDLLCTYEKQTEYRDRLKQISKEEIENIIDKINLNNYDNQVLQDLILKLSDKLSKTKGKKVYGYLRSDVKDIIDNIVNELESQEDIKKLYDLWYEQREEVIKTYTENLPKRIPLSQNKEFKSIKNIVINEVLNILEQGNCSDIQNINNNINTNYNSKNSYTSICVIRLLNQISKVLQNNILNEQRNQMIDRKLKRKINEKKQSHGLKQG